ncbi:MAG: chorismate mutase [Anaerolineae bacterium]|jgi:isochorismate pyruvate lyase|nr:chorismate mutase [Anaerolineae bacterium]
MSSLNELRAQIDEIDHQIILLLSQRGACVREIAEIKKSAEHVSVPAREQEIFQTRRTWAAEGDLSPEFIEDLYRRIIAYFTERQQQLLQRQDK